MEVLVLVAIGTAAFRWAISHPQRLYGYKPAEERWPDSRTGKRTSFSSSSAAS